AAVYHADPAIVQGMRALDAVSPLRTGEGILGRVVASGVPTVVPKLDPDEIVARAPAEYRELVRRMEIVSLISVPLRSRARILGGLSFSRTGRERPPYTDEDLDLVTDLADRAALAIDNAWLIKSLEQRVAERTVALEEALDRANDAARAKS